MIGWEMGSCWRCLGGGAVKELEERGDDGGNSTRRIRSTGELRVRIAKGSNESEEREEMEKDTSGNFFG